MKERSIGIRELKTKLSACVREVKRGATIVVTERGKRVARLVPETESVEERIEMLTRAGSVRWSGRRLGRAKPEPRRSQLGTVSQILVENRE